MNLYRAIVQRRVLQCGYAESKRNVLRRILNVLTDGAVRQLQLLYCLDVCTVSGQLAFLH